MRIVIMLYAIVDIAVGSLWLEDTHDWNAIPEIRSGAFTRPILVLDEARLRLNNP